MLSLSSLFNADWYLEKNPDVAAAVEREELDALHHFEQYGHSEGRDPGPLFDTQYYLAANVDVARAVNDGLLSAYDHFVQYGASENRSPFALFDSDLYLSQNPDVAQAVNAGLITAVQHYVAHGHSEGRQISPSPEPTPKPDPEPTPTPEQGGVLLSLFPQDWTASSNRISFDLEFTSSLQLNDISLQGSGSLSTSSSTITTGGTSNVSTTLSAHNGSQSGKIGLEFIVPTGSGSESISILNFTINGNVYPDITHPLTGKPGTEFQYENLSISNTFVTPTTRDDGWDEIFSGVDGFFDDQDVTAWVDNSPGWGDASSTSEQEEMVDVNLFHHIGLIAEAPANSVVDSVA